MSGTAEGLLLVDKPEGPTSHDVVDRIRRATGQRRTGHAGTLDPIASGLLPLVLGRATRLVRFLTAEPKVYSGVLRLGVRTATDDVSGETLARHDGPLPGDTEVRSAAERLRGTIRQVPPAVSAKKLAGRRAYALVRQGRAVEIAPVEVEIVRFDLRPAGEPDLWAFEAEVSGGTYVRALARDLGEALGCGGTLVRLRRTAVGVMDVGEALPLSDIEEDPAAAIARIVPLDAMPLDLPAVRLPRDEDVRRFASGAAVRIDDPSEPGSWCRVLSPGGALVGVGETGAGRLQPRVVVAAGAPAD